MAISSPPDRINASAARIAGCARIGPGFPGAISPGGRRRARVMPRPRNDVPPWSGVPRKGVVRSDSVLDALSARLIPRSAKVGVQTKFVAPRLPNRVIACADTAMTIARHAKAIRRRYTLPFLTWTTIPPRSRSMQPTEEQRPEKDQAIVSSSSLPTGERTIQSVSLPWRSVVDSSPSCYRHPPV
jgi:hypothetical protein